MLITDGGHEAQFWRMIDLPRSKHQSPKYLDYIYRNIVLSDLQAPTDSSSSFASRSSLTKATKPTTDRVQGGIGMACGACRENSTEFEGLCSRIIDFMRLQGFVGLEKFSTEADAGSLTEV